VLKREEGLHGELEVQAAAPQRTPPDKIPEEAAKWQLFAQIRVQRGI
jgi:hypothetical protein